MAGRISSGLDAPASEHDGSCPGSMCWRLEVYAPSMTRPSVIHKGAYGDGETDYGPASSMVRASVRRPAAGAQAVGKKGLPGWRLPEPQPQGAANVPSHPLAAGNGRDHLSPPRDRPAAAC